jgi:excisionase family DNA binding protein
MPWMTSEEAGEILNYHPETVREMLRSGRLQGRKFGNVWWVDSASVDRFKRRIDRQGLDKNDPRRGEE